MSRPTATILRHTRVKIVLRLRVPIPPPNRETKTGHEDARRSSAKVIAPRCHVEVSKEDQRQG